MQRRAEREGRKSCDTGWWESHAVVGGPAPDDGGDDAHDDEDKPDLAQNTAHGEPVLVLLVAVAWICARAAGGAVRRVFVTSALGVDTIVVALRTLLPRVALDGVRRLKPAKRGVGRADEKQREARWRHNLAKFAAFACFHPLTYTIPNSLNSLDDTNIACSSAASLRTSALRSSQRRRGQRRCGRTRRMFRGPPFTSPFFRESSPRRPRTRRAGRGRAKCT